MTTKLESVGHLVSDSANTSGIMEAANELKFGNEQERFHPLFSSPDGDVILAAKGGELFFRVHTFTLKMTSGFFRTMYSLPQYVSTSFAACSS